MPLTLDTLNAWAFVFRQVPYEIKTIIARLESIEKACEGAKWSINLILEMQRHKNHQISMQDDCLDPAKALRMGGIIALIYSFSAKPDNQVMLGLSEMLYRESENALSYSWNYKVDISRWTQELKGSGFFTEPVVKRYPWKKKFSTEEYAGLLRTYSDFLSLPNKLQVKLSKMMKDCIDSDGGRLEKPYESVTVLAECIAG
jgi:hypothetical protein